MRPVTDKGYQLLHDGCIALAQIEGNGIKIDVDYIHRAIKHADNKIKKIIALMKEDDIYRTWKKRYKAKTNLGSRSQLGHVLFDILKFPYTKTTDKGIRPATDAEALSGINNRFVKNLLKVEKIKKAQNTYLRGILREVDEGFLHPFFNLHTVSTYRGSSDHPNFQNQPIRDAEIKKLVRRAFIARRGNRIVELDYGGVEICSATCYHLDPAMIRYIEDKTKDLHRDMAMKCFMLKQQQVTKDIRYCGKNMFVFPQFYGDYYVRNAESLWEAITKMKLVTTDGTKLKQHLRDKGIIKRGACNPKHKAMPGTFEHHLRKVESDFWNKQFKVYKQWKKDWYNAYLESGGFTTLTGFVIEGLYKRNEVINYPPQGTAFHWLLWSLIRIQKILKKHHMKTLLIGQIHDSLVADSPKGEVKDYLAIAKQVMTEDIRKYWKWIIVPLTIDAEITPVGGSWYEKKKIKIA